MPGDGLIRQCLRNRTERWRGPARRGRRRRAQEGWWPVEHRLGCTRRAGAANAMGDCQTQPSVPCSYGIIQITPQSFSAMVLVLQRSHLARRVRRRAAGHRSET